MPQHLSPEWLARFAELTCGRAWVLRPTDPVKEIAAMAQKPHEAPVRFGW